MGIIKRSVIGTCIVCAGLGILQLEPAVVRDLRAGDFHVGAVRVSLWSAAQAQATDRLALDNVSFKSGPTTYEAKQVFISNLSSSRADIDALLSKGSTEPAAERLSRVSAASVMVPELIVTVQIGGASQTITYRNVGFKNVSQGKIAEVSIEATEGVVTEATGKTTFGYGRSTVSDLDLPALARLYEAKAGPVPDPLSKIHGPFSLENLRMSEPDGATFAAARISGRDFMARTIKESWTGATTLFAQLSAKDELSDEDQGRLLSTLGDFIGAFDVGYIEATGITTKLAVAEKKVSKVLDVKIDRMAYTAAIESAPSDIRVEGLEIHEPDARISIASTSLTGFSLRPTIEGLKALEGKSFDDLDTSTLRGLIPTIGTFRQTGSAIDVRESKVDGEQRNAIKGTTREFEFTADKPLNGAPTNIRLSWQNMTIALPAGSDESWVKEIRALGYEALDTSLVLAAHWNEATNEIAVTEISIEGKELGRVMLDSAVGNVTRDAFSADHGTAAAALLSARPKSVRLHIDDSALLGRILDRTAKQEKTSPQKQRDVYAEGATLMTLGMLGGSPAAKQIAREVAAFIRGADKLTIEARTKNPAGLTVLELLAVKDLTKILEKIDVKVQ
jgi:hypothetical protein